MNVELLKSLIKQYKHAQDMIDLLEINGDHTRVAEFKLRQDNAAYAIVTYLDAYFRA